MCVFGCKKDYFHRNCNPGQIGNTFRITTAQCPILNQFESIYDPFSLHYFVIISLFLEGYFMVIVMAPYKWDILGKKCNSVPLDINTLGVSSKNFIKTLSDMMLLVIYLLENSHYNFNIARTIVNSICLMAGKL